MGFYVVFPVLVAYIRLYGRLRHPDKERFVWDSEKAAINLAKHGVAFDEAIDVFFDAAYRLVDASVPGERREAAIGFGGARRLLYVVNIEVERETTRIISARLANATEKRHYEELA
jgi:uncharacterized DUF497 family protein